jgi:hypothetical protein
MKSLLRAAFTVALLCSAAGTLVLTAPAAVAADEQKLSAKVAKPLSDAIKAAQAKDYPTALADVKLAQAVEGRTPFEDYKINAILTFIAINMKDYDTATTAIEAAADSPVMPDADKPTTLRNALLLSAQAKQYQKAIAYGQQLQALGPLDPTLEGTLAQVYYYLQDFVHAQQYAQMTIDADKAAGKTPDEAVLQIVMIAQAKQNNMGGAQETLENLAVNFNKPESWSQLIDIALSRKGVKDPDALYLLRLKFIIPGAMRDDDYASLANVANLQGYPTEALNALQKGIQLGKITTAQAGSTFSQARNGAAMDQRSLGQYAAQAERAKSGQQDIKLAEDYWGYGRYADASAAAARAVAKGGMTDPSEGPMLIGMLDVVQGKYDAGVQSLSQVTGSPTRMASAHLWTLYAQAQLKASQPPAPPPATPPAQ